MAEIPKGTNQGTLVHGDPYAFPCFGNIGSPMMATLNLPGFTVGLPVWLFMTPVVLNAPNASKERTLCQAHQTNLVPSHSSPIKYSPPPSSSVGESTSISSQGPRKKKRKNQKRNKKKGGKPLASSSQDRGKQPIALSNEVGGKQSTIISQASGTHIVEKPKKIRCKSRFSCKLCKRDQCTHLCLSS